MQPASPPAQFAVSEDGTRIAYDVVGSGPFVMLLHGGGQTRRVWHEVGYAARLALEFTVVSVDLRGNGESDKPVTAAAYGIDRHVRDLLAVADRAGASTFTLPERSTSRRCRNATAPRGSAPTSP